MKILVLCDVSKMMINVKLDVIEHKGITFQAANLIGPEYFFRQS